MINQVCQFYGVSVVDHPARQGLNTPKESATLFNAIASLVDLPDDGRLFKATKPVVMCLIHAWEHAMGSDFESIVEEINDLYQKTTSLPTSGATWGVRESNPVFAFLLYSLDSDEKAQLSLQYHVLVPFLLRRIHQCHAQVENATDSYLYHLSLAARKLVVAAPVFPPVPKFNLKCEYKQRLAMSALQKKLDEGVELTTASEWAYISDLLFRDRKCLGKGGGGHSGKREARWLMFEQDRVLALTNSVDSGGGFHGLESDNDCFSPDGKGKVERRCFVHPDADQKLLASVGEHDADYVHDHEIKFPASWFDDPWAAKRKMRGKQEAMLASERILLWDLRCLSLTTIHSILAQCQVLQSEPWRAILAMTLLLGSSKEGLKKLKIGILTEDGDPSDELTEKLMQGCRFYDPVKRQLWWLNFRGAEDAEGYLNVPLIVRLKLPRTITRHLPAAGEQGALAFTKNDFTKAKTFLKRLGEDGISVPTLGRLQATFEALFIHGAGLPELLADHLQERCRNHLTSQHYYVSIPWSYAVRVWRRMLSSFLRAPKTSISELIKNMAIQSVPEAFDDTDEFVGAVKTPDAEALKKNAMLLLSRFPDSLSEMQEVLAVEWNTYASYLYFLFSVCTGRRPQRDPFPLFSDFDLEAGSLYIDDKWNRKFKESRVIPICPTLKQAMINHLAIHNKQFMRWKMRGYSSEVPVNQMFLVDVNSKVLVEITHGNLDRLTNLSTEQEYFEGLGNGCRHFLLTRLHQVGVPQEMIDFISGHRHVAREPEMSVSLLNWADNAQILSDKIEKEIVQHLGLRVPFSDV